LWNLAHNFARIENEDSDVFGAPFWISSILPSVAMSNHSLNPTVVAAAPPARNGHRSNCVPMATVKSDGDLLRSFLRNRDEPAFAELVERFGPLIYAIALRILRNHHAAEDAFQATFMILASDQLQDSHSDQNLPPKNLIPYSFHQNQRAIQSTASR